MNIYTVLALAGFAGYVTTYALVQLGMLDGNSLRCSVANVVASALVLVTIVDNFDVRLAVLQIAWIGFGLVGVATRLRPRIATRHRLELVPALENNAPAGADGGSSDNVRRLVHHPRRGKDMAMAVFTGARRDAAGRNTRPPEVIRCPC